MLLRRPRSLRAATALAASARLLSSSPSVLQNDSNPTNPSWPLLRRRSRPESSLSPEDDSQIPLGEPLLPLEMPESQKDQDMSSPSASASASPTATASPVTSETENGDQPRDPRVMLTIKGLSTNLNASDFYRLAPSDLSSWQSVIRKIQQQRDTTTLEPLGQYNISFSTGPAAISYRDRLIRLHKLSLHRLDNVHGLWESLVPLHLRSAAGDDPATELETFTVTSGLPRGADPEVSRRRVVLTHRWAAVLEQLTHEQGGKRPPVVLVRVDPPAVTEAQLGTWIREDGDSRGFAWDVFSPRKLRSGRPASREPDDNYDDNYDVNDNDMTDSYWDDMNTRDPSRGLFVVVCGSDVEARRFQRRWNQKTVPARQGNVTASKNVVHASIINW
ncbi:hypothetical protein E4U21_003175 [Claviceps maximensis]|nr:hypothetical protein E4U21_003175 [Claviceps maximensis]